MSWVCFDSIIMISWIWSSVQEFVLTVLLGNHLFDLEYCSFRLLTVLWSHELHFSIGVQCYAGIRLRCYKLDIQYWSLVWQCYCDVMDLFLRIEIRCYRSMVMPCNIPWFYKQRLRGEWIWLKNVWGSSYSIDIMIINAVKYWLQCTLPYVNCIIWCKSHIRNKTAYFCNLI